MAESVIQKLIRLAVAKASTMFRQNTGMAWASDTVFKPTIKTQVMMQPGDVLLRGARPLRAGLCVGSSDLIGWTSIRVTQEMVGRLLAVFTAIECKVPGKNATDEQQIFIDNVRKAGGFAGVAHNEKEALDICVNRCENHNSINNQ